MIQNYSFMVKVKICKIVENHHYTWDDRQVIMSEYLLPPCWRHVGLSLIIRFAAV